MSKGKLAKIIADNLKHDGINLTKAQRIIDNVFDGITEILKAEGKFTINGFGSFTVRTRGPRVYRNPMTGEPVPKDESNRLHFGPALELKKKLESAKPWIPPKGQEDNVAEK